MSKSTLELRHLQRTFIQGDQKISVLNDANLHLKAGEIVALVGPSGSGKSTLLQLAGLLEFPSEGEVYIAGNACGKMNDRERTTLRLNMIGYVYQFHHLLPEFSALENIMLPQLIAGRPPKEAAAHATRLLQSFNLENRATHRPSRLSGGEQQRVAILRAVANQPKLLLADEPTGNLDEATAEIVFNELVGLVRKHQMAALIATHNPELAKRMDRTIQLHNGCLMTV
ncbi:MAG: ABC transporter ATP-binding protein [Candidatus Paracaedimonas acanthamoebae]|uniref:ABC transporter ATP-binding protein n=1 Tax=Candidatus Paracaedimonas acanthamoebae TaxID=244581 RepID=A0A8J7TW01_9PROT|nr:ABC transporter ATP-binding protein [Candidatus Paracaedimonas acanthamoebae]